MEEGCTGMIAPQRGDIVREKDGWEPHSHMGPPPVLVDLHEGWCGVIVDFTPRGGVMWYNVMQILMSGTGVVHRMLLTDDELATYIEVVG